MAWGLNIPQFPILTPGQMSPFNQAMTQGLDTYQNMMKAVYQPKLWEAEAQSKSAYAQNLGSQIASTLLNNPLVAAQLLQNNPSGYNDLVNRAAQTNIQNTPTKSSGLLTQLWNKVLGEGEAKPQAVSSQVSSNQIPISSTTGSTGPRIVHNRQEKEQAIKDGVDWMDASVLNQNGQNQDNSPVLRGTQPSPYPTPQEVASSNFAKNAPYTPQGMEARAKLKTAETRATTDVQTNAELWKDRIKEQGKVADAAAESEQNLVAMDKAYAQLKPWEKGMAGPIPLGKGPAMTDAAQQFDKYAARQSATNIRAMQTGHVTNVDFQIGDKMLPGRWLNDEAYHNMSNYNKFINDRIKQKKHFMSQAKADGLTVDEADNQWTYFMETHPAFSQKTGKVLRDNAKMNAYNALTAKNNLTPSNIKKTNKVSDKDIIEHNGKIYKRINNNWFEV